MNVYIYTYFPFLTGGNKMNGVQWKQTIYKLSALSLIVSTLLLSVNSPALASDPEDDLAGLIAEVEALVDNGSINPGNGNALIVKLQAAQRSLARGRINAAVNQIEDFKSQVNDFVQNGKLGTQEGQPLIDEAAYIQVIVQCSDPLGCASYRVGEPIRIASALAISGPIAYLGLDSQRGVEIALDLQGSLYGHPLELLADDAMCSPEGGTAAANALVSDPLVAAVVGTSCSSAAFSAAPIISEAGYVMVSPSNTSPLLTQPDLHEAGYLRTAFNDREQATAMAGLARYQSLDTSAVIVASELYTQVLGNMFVEAFSAAGGDNLAFEIVPSSDPTDISAALDVIAQNGPPDILYLPVFPNEGLEIVLQARTRPEFDATVLASADSLSTSDFLAAAGDAAEGMLISHPSYDFTGNDIYTNVLLPAYLARYGDPLSVFHGHAFDAANMIIAGIEAVAVEFEGTVQVGRQALREALFATENFEGATGTLTCDPYGDCAAAQIVVSTVIEGNLVPIWP
jgi:branched-chain amino acid transport system substrate-binding protein